MSRTAGSDGKRRVTKVGSIPGGADWISVQVGGDLFQMQNKGRNECRIIRSGSCSAGDARNMPTPSWSVRANFSLANMAERFVAMTGGEDAS